MPFMEVRIFISFFMFSSHRFIRVLWSLGSAVQDAEGKLDFGPWEQIFYGEFDGGRRKRVLVKLIGE